MDSYWFMAGATGLETPTSAVTGQRSNQLSYVPRLLCNNLAHVTRTAEPSTVTFVLPYYIAVFGLTFGPHGTCQPNNNTIEFSRTSPNGVDPCSVAKHFSIQQRMIVQLQRVERTN